MVSRRCGPIGRRFVLCEEYLVNYVPDLKVTYLLGRLLKEVILSHTWVLH